jgi:Ca2+-binding RTX toxin-like protein
MSYANATAGVTVSLILTAVQNTFGAGLDTLSGFENLTGSDFNDDLQGTAGVNVLTGLGGNDILRGDLGADIFVFRDNDGDDRITTFENNIDICDLTGVAGVHGFGDLRLTDTGPGVLIDYGTGSVLFAKTGNIALVDASDFLFA